jgi:hypothetical protein
VLFPVSLVWYAVWSRGWRGLVMVAALAGLLLLPTVAAIVTWVLLHGGA